MDLHKKLKQQLIDLIGANPNLPITGVVKSIENDTCTVEVLNGLELSDVRLKATTNGSDHLLVVPKIGSTILMLSSDGTVDNMTVIKCDQASKIVFKENGLVIEIDSTDGKIQIKNNETSLKDLFEKSANIKKSMKVSTPMGPSGTPLPDVLQMITNFETEFKKLLK
ncbi:hypothetical protein [Chryseobacterium sp.]|uniref:hypothetical protein n=1 Tax=Chryseobacterium sp. TaxID=1871047 RepID=UPI00289E3D19|nr:hypothetical protein [Chryseobacterium sp.]